MRELSDSEKEAIVESGQVLADIAEALRTAIILALPWIIRFMALVIAGGGVSLALYCGWTAYGGDMVAIIPAAVVALTPLALVMNYSLGLGGFVFAGLVSGLAGYLILIVPDWARVLALGSVAGVGIAAQFHKRGGSNEGGRADGTYRGDNDDSA